MPWLTAPVAAALLAVTTPPAAPASQDNAQCSPSALPEAERRAMETRFRQIAERQGRAAAETYAREQAQAFRQRLIAQGICSETDTTPSPRQSPAPRAPQPAPEARQPASQTDGPRCRVENRALPDLNGGMSLVLVTVCD